MNLPHAILMLNTNTTTRRRRAGAWSGSLGCVSRQ